MKVKKVCLIIVISFFQFVSFSQTFSDLVDSVLNKNTEILNAQNAYESAQITRKTLNGNYVPGISVSGTSSFDDKFKQSYMDSQITYAQPIVSGTTISASGVYSYSLAEYGTEQYIMQTPYLSFSLSQSLFPFWVQGTIRDPAILSLKQQENYYYNQLLYTEKSVIQNLIQVYAYMQVYKNEAQIYRNYIKLVDEQISALRELKKSGNVNQAKITELESSKWSYQMDLMSVETNYNNYLQNLKSLCNIEINVDEFNFEHEPLVPFNLDFDPLEKIYNIKIQMLKTERIKQKQSAAPVLNLSVKPKWSLNTQNKSEWKDAWKKRKSCGSKLDCLCFYGFFFTFKCCCP